MAEMSGPWLDFVHLLGADKESIHSASVGIRTPAMEKAATISAAMRKPRDKPGPKLAMPSAVPNKGRTMPAMGGPIYRQVLVLPKLSLTANIKRPKQLRIEDRPGCESTQRSNAERTTEKVAHL
jgi:hypothetical protein